MPNLNLAFSVGAIVSLVELPGALLGWNVMHTVCVVGWLFVLGGTLYLNFRFAARTVRLDIFQFVGGIASLVIFGSFLYAFVVAPVEATATVLSLIELVKTILIINGCAALVSAVTCYFLFAIASSFVTFDEVRR